ncbi:MAG TPA: PQQ-binding-like beta-propeller repeat protein [Microlunatus sp.]
MSTPGGPRQGSAEPDRWAPFPVQDWSTMPVSASDPYAYVDGSWGPPQPVEPVGPAGGPGRDDRPRWLPLLAVVLVTVLVAGGLFVTEHVGAAAGGAAAIRYTPADGRATYQQRTTTVASESVTSTYVQESAIQTGGSVLGGLDSTLGDKVAAVVGRGHLDRMRFWRTTSSQIGNLGSSQQNVRVYRIDGAVELIAESDQGGADVYSPGLVELPAEVAAGDRWSGEGSVGSRRYRNDFRAAAAEPGCLRVSGTVAETTAAGQQGTSREVQKTWCGHRGVVFEEIVRGEVSVRVDTVSAPAADPTLRTVGEEWAWSDPDRWRRRAFDLISADASLGSGPMTGSPSRVPPVLTASGLIIRPTVGDDLVATTPKTVDRWTSLWRMHPGGTILSVAAFGDVVVATTSRRELVGYSDAGIRLWSRPLDDVAFWAPVRVDDRRVGVADAAGVVTVVDLLTGEAAWQQRVNTQVSAPVVATPEVVVVLDAGGAGTAFAADSGERLWSKELSGTLGAALGGVVVVRNGTTLEALDLRTGRHRWLLPQTGTLDALQPFGDLLVSATQLGTSVIDEQGTIRENLPAYEWVSVVGDTMVGWGRTEAEFRDSDLALRTTIDTPDLTLKESGVPPLPYRQGVVVFERGWTFSTWSDEP